MGAINLVMQFVTTFISGVVGAERAAKEYVKGVKAQTSGLNELFDTNQAAEYDAEGQILSSYEKQLKKEKLIKELMAGGFVLFLIIVAILIVTTLSKSK